MNDDLISRKAVLGLPRSITRNFFGEIVEESINVKEIEALPSAQPEPTLEQIEEYCHKRCLSIVDNALLHKYAQAEIIRCKDCKYRDEEYRNISAKWLPCMEDIYLDSNWYCGSAERGEQDER